METKPYREKPFRGSGMEGPVARWYAAITRKDMEEFRSLARRVAAELAPGARVLEVAPGPGYFAVELAKLGPWHVTGLDISRTFVEIACRNAREAGVDVDFRAGNAAAMPFESGAFDFILCRAAFKNFAGPVRALQEMHRVLAPGGSALIIDLCRDAAPEGIARHVAGMRLNPLNALLVKLIFRFMLLPRAYTRREIEAFAAQTEFRAPEFSGDLVGLEIRLRK